MGETNIFKELHINVKLYYDRCYKERVQSSVSQEWTLDLLREIKVVFSKEVVQSADLEIKESVPQEEPTQSPVPRQEGVW